MKRATWQIALACFLAAWPGASNLFAGGGGLPGGQLVPKSVPQAAGAIGSGAHIAPHNPVQQRVIQPQHAPAGVVQGRAAQVQHPQAGQHPAAGAAGKIGGKHPITDRAPIIKPQVTNRPPQVKLPQKPQVQPNPRINSGASQSPGNVAPKNPKGSNRPILKSGTVNVPNVLHNNPAGNGTRRIQSQLRQPGKTQQMLGGNQINLGNRSINLANKSYRPAYQWHPRRYAGYWNGNYGSNGFGWGYGSGGYGYGYRPLGWGLGAWGLGSLAYNSGYLGYYNPYYTSGGYTGYNYSQPVPILYSAAPATSNAQTADSLLDAAIAAFQQNDYDQAQDIVNKGISQYPSDAVLHEFRALVLFAKSDYQQAASTIHSVLAVGPGWNWETLSGLYADVAIYTTQLRALEAFTRQNTEDAGSRFLLAYHYMVGGHQDAAARKLQEVVKLSPNDRVAADLLAMMTHSANNQPAATEVAPTPQPPATTQTQPDASTLTVDPSTLVGTWNASRDDGSRFQLVLDQDGAFHWNFTQKEMKNEFTGHYTIHGNILALERNDGGSLVATITPGDKQDFNFKLVGAPSTDPGLEFHH